MSVSAGNTDSFDSVVTAINGPISAFAWGWPTVGLISVTGILLMVGLKFMPILRLSYGVRMMLAPSDPRAEGDISLTRRSSQSSRRRARCWTSG